MPLPFRLLALLHEPEDSVRVVPLTADVQATLAADFAQQAEAFLTPAMELVSYAPGYHPDPDELLRIESFELAEALGHALKEPDIVPALTEGDLEAGVVRALVGVVTHGSAPDCLFQKFDKRQVLRRGPRSLVFRNNHFGRMDMAGLQIDSHLAALHRNGILYFRSEEVARRFLDLDAYFREATAAELEAFGRMPIWSPGAEASLLDADRWLRRKVTSIVERGVLEGQTPKKLQKLAHAFGLDVRVTRQGGRDRLTLPAEKKHLKLFVRLLAEDLFNSVLTGEQYLANSKRPLR